MKNRALAEEFGGISLVVGKSEGLTKLKRLAFRQKYYSYRNPLETLRVLADLYQKRRSYAEMKTCRSVDACRHSISFEVNAFFQYKSRQVHYYINHLLEKDAVGKDSLTSLLNEAELKEIIDLAGHILSKEISKRFKISPISPILTINLEGLEHSFSLFKEWQRAKEKTVFLTEQAHKWSSKAWRRAVDSVMTNEIMAQSVDQLDFDTKILEDVGVSIAKEKEELLEGMAVRVKGLLENIRLRVVNDINKQAAEIFYAAHDLLVDEQLKEKITLLEEKIANIDMYQSERVYP